MTPVAKQRARILTVDPSTRRIEGTLKDGSMVQIAVWEIPSFFRWPQVGEWWTITRQSGVWMLGHFMEESDNGHKIEDTGIGEAKVNADSIKTASGNDVVITDQSLASDGDIIVWHSANRAWIPQVPAAVTIADGSITTAKLADGAVTSLKIFDGTIATGDLATATIQSFLQLAVAGNLHISIGSGSFVFTASATSAAVVVTHNLGTTPTIVVGSMEAAAGGSGTFTFVIAQGTVGGTTFQCEGRTTASTTITRTFYWIAIG